MSLTKKEIFLIWSSFIVGSLVTSALTYFFQWPRNPLSCLIGRL